MLCSLFYMPCELHPRIKVIVYVSFFRLNELNFDNCSQLEPKNRKSSVTIRNCGFRTKYQVLSELFDVSWNTWFSDRKSQFSREIQDISNVNPNFLFGKSGISTFVTIACHTYSGHFILPYNIRNHPTCLKGLGIYMQSIYSWHKNGMFF
jgi:hypothetical protein